MSEICARLFTIRRRLRPGSASAVPSSPFFVGEETEASDFLGALEDVDEDADCAVEVLALAEEAESGGGGGLLEAVVLFILNVALVRVSKGVSRRRASARTASIAVERKSDPRLSRKTKRDTHVTTGSQIHVCSYDSK